MPDLVRDIRIEPANAPHELARVHLVEIDKVEALANLAAKLAILHIDAGIERRQGDARVAFGPGFCVGQPDQILRGIRSDALCERRATTVSTPRASSTAGKAMTD